MSEEAEAPMPKRIQCERKRHIMPTALYPPHRIRCIMPAFALQS